MFGYRGGMGYVTLLTEKGTLSAIDSRRLRTLYAYWEAQRGTRSMPSRQDIDPLDMEPSVLPYIMLTEVKDGGRRFFYRLAGTALTEVTGSRMTGHYLDELLHEPYRTYILGLYRELVTRRQPLYSESTYFSPTGGLDRYTHRLMLPLSEDGETVSMVLAGQLFRSIGRRHPARAVFDKGDFSEGKRILL